eukprot:CAMPEP_0177729002 /NCGR_PEP_ID=MMETSP0484_2-20121128/21189_1 /TAXON_ID=354590 /ORGANISM="Rhodomonas lens, Strain RHODO" /LENGTH=229 /DNA_ID=CAMNT_0019241827 /DNA_START=148 /DNA_END=834 /DNA_ORIENTATION=+
MKKLQTALESHAKTTVPDKLQAKAAEAQTAPPPRSSSPRLHSTQRKQLPIPQGKILWEEKTQTFRLYSKSTLYAFRVDEGLNLEHLYWGKAIPPDDDLRFMAFTNVQLCFDPGPMSQFEDTVIIDELLDVHEQADSDGDDAMLEEWKNARKMRVLEDDPFGLDPDGLQSKDRRENAAWRLMKMRELQKQRAEEGEDKPEEAVQSKLQRAGSTPTLGGHGEGAGAGAAGA